MEDTIKMSFDFITDLSKQIITLSTGILALSITFIKDIPRKKTKLKLTNLQFSWLFYLVSICCGIWTMMALTGTLTSAACGVNKNLSQFGFNISFPSGLQILNFLIATFFLVLFGIKSSRNLQ